MSYNFYDVETGCVVSIDESDIRKIVYSRRLKTGRTQLRYALRGRHHGRWLTKFCTKALFDRLKVPVEHTV